MQKIVKILSGLFAVMLLCSCSVKIDKNNTTSNTTTAKNATSYSQTTTEAVAEPVENSQNLSKSKVIWGPGNIDNHQQPSDPLSLQETFEKYDAKWLVGNDKKVCLTFDEGYENGFTPMILDTLKEKKVKAIFFVTYDFASSNPELIKRMIDEGHIVGNHSWHHYSMDEIDDETAKEEVLYLQNYIHDKFNYTMSYFRYPKGEFSEHSLALVKDLGYKSVFWSFAYADWDVDNQLDEDTAFQKVCESTHNGEIILLHAVSETNAKILGRVIDDIRQQGYKFVLEV